MSTCRLKSDTCFSWVAVVAAWVGYRPVEYTFHERVNSARTRLLPEEAVPSAHYKGPFCSSQAISR